MAGYSGIEPLVFQVLSRVLQQADITKVAVHMTASSDAASTELPKTAMHVSPTRAEGIAHAKSLLLPLAEAAKPDAEKDEGDATCPIVLRIQPFFEEVLPSDARNLFHKPAQAATQQDERSVSFLVWWVDSRYELSHATCSQVVPAWWRTYLGLTQSLSRWSTTHGSSRQ